MRTYKNIDNYIKRINEIFINLNKNSHFLEDPDQYFLEGSGMEDNVIYIYFVDLKESVIESSGSENLWKYFLEILLNNNIHFMNDLIFESSEYDDMNDFIIEYNSKNKSYNIEPNKNK